MQTKASVQKELCTILTDQGLWVTGMNKQRALQVLFQQHYFDPEKLSLVLDDMVKTLGGWLYFVCKYHPGFNFIHRYWVYGYREASNQIVNSWVYAVIFSDHAIQKYSEIFISENLYIQVDKKGHIYTLLDEIMDHRKDENEVTQQEVYTEDSNGRRIIDITTKRWIFLVNWKD